MSVVLMLEGDLKAFDAYDSRVVCYSSLVSFPLRAHHRYLRIDVIFEIIGLLSQWVRQFIRSPLCV